MQRGFREDKYLSVVAVMSFDFALAATFQVLLNLDLRTNLLTPPWMDGALGQKNLKRETIVRRVIEKGENRRRGPWRGNLQGAMPALKASQGSEGWGSCWKERNRIVFPWQVLINLSSRQTNECSPICPPPNILLSVPFLIECCQRSYKPERATIEMKCQ